MLARNLLGRPTRVLRAVRGVSLSIERGATLALVGESGSGKSTLGRCIAGLLRPTSGSVELAGHDVQRLSGAALLAFRRQVQTIFQDPYSSLNPRRTVGDAIMDGMVIHKLCGAEERQARMLALLSRVGLQPDHARRYPHQFSGGQRQHRHRARAGVGAALHRGRRGRVGAGRVGQGPGAGPASRPAGRAWPDLSVHFA